MLAVPRCSGGFSFRPFLDRWAASAGRYEGCNRRNGTAFCALWRRTVGIVGGLIMNESSKGVKNVMSLQLARERTRQAKAASDRQISKRSNQRLLERRMHSFGTVWWSSCLRFKRCTMVPNSSCRHLADFDDDTLAKTWLHDVNTALGKGTQSFIGMPVSARHAEKGCLWALSSSLIFSRSRSVTSRLNREFSSWSLAIRSSPPRV